MDPISAMNQASIPGLNLVARLLEPTAKKLGSKLQSMGEVTWHKLFNSLEGHLQRTLERNSFFTSIIFPNQQKRLDDYYLPLTLVDSGELPLAQITRYPRELLEQFRSLLVVDTAGMGKSTLLKFIFVCAAREQQTIPVFIELRKLTKDRLLLDFLLEQLKDLDGKLSTTVVFSVIAEGGFTFFLDGYDEIPEEHREAVTAHLQDFKAKASKNYFLMASRDHRGLVAFADFKRVSIRPLELTEAYALLQKYSAASGIADKLIERLRAPENASVHEFLVNPLLVALLFKSFEYKATIPLKKHVFYWQVYEALFEAHDLTKEGGEFVRAKKSGLDLDSFHRVVRSLAILAVEKQQLELLPDQLAQVVQKAKRMSGVPSFRPIDFVYDLANNVPLFVRDGNYLRWAHKSIQEYFAAAYICMDSKERQSAILNGLYESPRGDQYLNILSLCFDIDPKAFRKELLFPILESLITSADALYTWADGKIEDALVKRRRELLTPNKIFMWRTKGAPPIELLPRGNMRSVDSNDMNAVEYHRKGAEIIRGRDPRFLASQSTFPGYNPTVVTYLHQKTSFFRMLSYTLNPSFVVTHSGHSLNPDILGIVPGEKNEYFTLIDDSDPRAFFNTKENFHQINQRLEKMGQWWIDLEIARKMLGQIEREIAEDGALSFTF